MASFVVCLRSAELWGIVERFVKNCAAILDGDKEGFPWDDRAELP